jgi:hypothetical protein
MRQLERSSLLSGAKAAILSLAGVASAVLAVSIPSDAAILTAPKQQPVVLSDTAGTDVLLIEDGTAIVVVNAPDGPTLETRRALEQARSLGAKSLTGCR